MSDMLGGAWVVRVEIWNDLDINIYLEHPVLGPAVARFGNEYYGLALDGGPEVEQEWDTPDWFRLCHGLMSQDWFYEAMEFQTVALGRHMDEAWPDVPMERDGEFRRRPVAPWRADLVMSQYLELPPFPPLVRVGALYQLPVVPPSE